MARNLIIQVVVGLASLPCLTRTADSNFEEHMVEIDSDLTTNLTKLTPVNHVNSRQSAHQNAELAPSFPILQVSSDLILAAIRDDNLPIAGPNSTLHPRAHKNLLKRDAEPCGPGSPCPDKSCCSKKGKCGFGPDYCDKTKCISNCDALAMCGKYSDGGTQKCGMNLCCSHYGWCGTDELHCGNPHPQDKAPCQAGFGLCKVIPPPSCGGGSVHDRNIGYYQASNTNDRLCNRISPSRINTAGYTHLYFAFAEIDPASYTIVVANDGDEERYREFNQLQSKGLKTWIAIGGFDFSDPGPSRNTWSNLVSTSSTRATFISSLKSFMAKYSFQGVDLDWEYPGTPERGGKRADTINYVSLLKEMRSSFGPQYGISLTLAPDYWYLRGFDAKGMEPYVDWFGFMAYDLHGFWDADIATLGAKVRGQTDVREIFNDTLPLWFDALNPAKINFGLALYGRGYTLANPGCNQLGCPFAGPSLPGPCTNFAGVMSLAEIQGLIVDRGIKPQLIGQAMMKQLTWDNQWIGYDDAETVSMKKKWANQLCFGGTMVWSVDFMDGSGSGDEVNGDSGPVTKDGTCGPKHGGTVCGDYAMGGCCSAAGYCGSDPDHCGNGCQSGPCYIQRETTDGTCGPNFGNSVCGSWAGGSCCSGAGFCGSTENFCGLGCFSGPCDESPSSKQGSGDVYIDPSVWTGTDLNIYCEPPCLYILPPLILSSTTTVSFPLFTTSLEVAWYTASVTTLKNGEVSTTTIIDRITEKTTLTIPPVITDQVDLWNVKITSQSGSVLVYPTSSILPPPFTITDDLNPWTQQGVIHSPVTRTITPPPFPYTTPVPDSNNHHPLTHRIGKPKPLCKSGCGKKCFGFFCHTPCLLDCIGGTLPGFHDPLDPLPEGSEPPTPLPADAGSGDDDDDNTSKSCTKVSTVVDAWVTCASGDLSCTTTKTSKIVGCDITASTTTANSCPLETDFDDQGSEDSNAPGIRIISPTPTITPGHTPKPLPTPSIFTSDCEVCTVLNGKNQDCTLIASCFSSVLAATPSSSVTTSVSSEPSVAPTSSSSSPLALVPGPTETDGGSAPSQPTPLQIVYVGYNTECTPDGGGLSGGGAACQSYWSIFAPSGPYNPCTDKAVYSDPDAFTANKPKYPLQLGDFNAGAFDTCVFQSDSDRVPGGMGCRQGVASCEYDTGAKQGCTDGADTWFPVSVCTLTAFDNGKRSLQPIADVQEFQSHNHTKALLRRDSGDNQYTWHEALAAGERGLALLAGPRTQSTKTSMEQLTSGGWNINNRGSTRFVEYEDPFDELEIGDFPVDEITATQSRPFKNCHGNQGGTNGKFESAFSVGGKYIVGTANYSPLYRARLGKAGISDDEIARMLPDVNKWSDVVWIIWADQAKDKAGKRQIENGNLRTPDDSDRGEVPVPLDFGWPGLGFLLGTDEYKAMLGTPHGKGMVRLVVDHPDELGSKGIESITLFVTQDPDIRDLEQYHILFTLTD